MKRQFATFLIRLILNSVGIWVASAAAWKRNSGRNFRVDIYDGRSDIFGSK